MKIASLINSTSSNVVTWRDVVAMLSNVTMMIVSHVIVTTTSGHGVTLRHDAMTVVLIPHFESRSLRPEAL